MKNLVPVAFFGLSLALVACSSSTAGNGGTAGGGPSTTENVVGKTCSSDADCGSGYACQPESSSGSGCTPDRACTSFECRGICLASGEIDMETGEPLAACMDDCGKNGKCCSGGGSGPTSGKCAKTSSTPSTTEDSGPAKTFSWGGTWNATVDYDVSCDWAGSIKKGHQKFTLTVKIEASGTSLTATPTTPTSGWDPMTGTGDGSGATISGEFPFRDHSGDSVGSRDNSVTLRLTTISGDKAASGSIEGKGSNGFGAKCTISNGTLEFAR